MMSAEPNTKPAQSKRHRPWVRLLRGVASVAVGLVILAAGLVALPIISPALSAQMADTLRSIVGPQPVAELESISFQIQDIFNRTRYQVTGNQPQISFADTPDAVEPTLVSIPTRAPRVLGVVATAVTVPSATPPSNMAESTPQSTSRAPAQTETPAEPPPTSTPPPDVVESSPYIDSGWQAFGPIVAGRPVLARGSLKPDPTRPYAQAVVVRIELSEVDINFVLGTQEPVSAKGTHPVSRTGTIPVQDQLPDKLLVAFNGGFKAIHGNYGVIVNGTTIITPLNGMASLAIYRDGSIDLGAWGRDINPSDNLLSLRQNCPLLLDGGQINPTVNDGNRKEWGYTVKNLDTTWRSGVGISRDGRFLIYVAGNSLTVQSLAQALLMAGAYHAMQLDINGFYTRFAIYRAPDGKTPAKHAVVADKLLNQMTIPPNQFLDPYDRDFFYVTLHGM